MENTTPTEARTGALFRFSAAKIWLNCGGFIALKQTLPPAPQSKDSDFGIRAHSLAIEIALDDFLQHKLTGSDPDIRLHLLSGNPEMEEDALKFRDDVFKYALEGSITGKAYGIEDRLYIDEKLGIYGHPDFWCVYKDDRGKRVGIIGDYKSLYTYVDEKRNPQLAAAAVALSIEAGGLDYVRAFIYQPRGKGEAYRETKFTAKQLELWEKKFRKAAETILQGKNQKFKVGPWCEDCECRPKCPKYGKELERKTSLQIIDVDKLSLPEPATLPDEVLKKLILHGTEIEGFLSACRKYAVNRYVNGHTISGLKLVSGKTRRQWNKATEAMAADMLKSKGIEPFNQKMKGIIEIERSLKASGLGKNIIDEYLTESTPGMILVGEDDPRPAVKNPLDLLSVENKEDE